MEDRREQGSQQAAGGERRRPKPHKDRRFVGVFRRLDLFTEERLDGDREAGDEHQPVADDGDEHEEERPQIGAPKPVIDLFL